MTAIFIHLGDAIDHVAEGDLAAGAVVVQGELVGITPRPIPDGHLGALQLRGVFDVSRVAGGIVGKGARVYWDEANQEATPNDDSGNNAYMGKTTRESADGDTTLRVRLDQ